MTDQESIFNQYVYGYGQTRMLVLEPMPSYVFAELQEILDGFSEYSDVNNHSCKYVFMEDEVYLAYLQTNSTDFNEYTHLNNITNSIELGLRDLNDDNMMKVAVFKWLK